MNAVSANVAKEYLYWAVVEHVRGWLGEDGAFRQAIEQKEGKLDGVTLRRIAVVYNVNRGIRAKDPQGDKHADRLAALLNASRPWPSDLVARAEKCLKVATEAKTLGHTSGLLASGVTKFSWFAQPEGWTVYDRFVSRAMETKSQETGQRMIEFYQKLQNNGFPELAEKIQMALDEANIMDLHSTRVLDKLMMLRGADVSETAWADNFRGACRGFLNILPHEWRQAVENLASHVVRRVDVVHFLRVA